MDLGAQMMYEECVCGFFSVFCSAFISISSIPGRFSVHGGKMTTGSCRLSSLLVKHSQCGKKTASASHNLSIVPTNTADGDISPVWIIISLLDLITMTWGGH